MKKGGPLDRLFDQTIVIESALNAIFKHLAGGECRHALGGDGNFFASFGVQALASRTLTGFEGAETKDGNFFAFNDGIDDGVDRGIHNHGHVSFGELSASRNKVDQISFVHLKGNDGGRKQL